LRCRIVAYGLIAEIGEKAYNKAFVDQIFAQAYRNLSESTGQDLRDPFSDPCASQYQILDELNALGARLVDSEDVRLEPAPSDMVVPRGFYSTTNHPTYIRLRGTWIPVDGSGWTVL